MRDTSFMVAEEKLFRTFIIKDSIGAFLVSMVSVILIILIFVLMQCSLTELPYGHGAYFAVNASYSTSNIYSPPDANGNRFTFYARILTGEYTVGYSRLKVPPAKDPSKSTAILFDSVVDNMDAPKIYVVFTDAQCYPEYLIIFK